MLKRLPAAFALLLGLLVALCACDMQNLPESGTPTAIAVLSPSPTTAADTATPQPPSPTQEQPTATSTVTEAPTLTPTAEESTPTLTATEEVATPTQETLPADTPTHGARVPTVTPKPRLTRTPTSTPDGSQPQPTVATGSTHTPVTEDPPTGGWSQVVRGPVGNKQVALTFDAGASGETCPRVLSTLRERGIHITMFFTGKFAEQYPDCITQAVADGHEIANHTYSHLDSRDLTDEQLSGELARTESIIQGLTGVSTKPYWRPPFGAYNNHVLNVAVAQGYRSIYWTLDSLELGRPAQDARLYIQPRHQHARLQARRRYHPAALWFRSLRRGPAPRA